MSGRFGTVVQVERVIKEGVPTVEVQVEADSESPETAEYMPPPNVDSLPMVGDEAMLEKAEGSGNTTAAGFGDPRNPGKAANGEYRAVGRDPETGEEVVEIWCKGNGHFEVNPLVPAYRIKLGKVEIDEDGNIKTPGEITGKAGTAAAVKLTTHLHATGVGPTQPPTPGT